MKVDEPLVSLDSDKATVEVPSPVSGTLIAHLVKEGDEVVLDGVYALKLTSSSQQAPAGYHYHADGALHKNH